MAITVTDRDVDSGTSVSSLSVDIDALGLSEYHLVWIVIDNSSNPTITPPTGFTRVRLDGWSTPGLYYNLYLSNSQSTSGSKTWSFSSTVNGAYSHYIRVEGATSYRVEAGNDWTNNTDNEVYWYVNTSGDSANAVVNMWAAFEHNNTTSWQNKPTADFIEAFARVQVGSAWAFSSSWFSASGASSELTQVINTYNAYRAFVALIFEPAPFDLNVNGIDGGDIAEVSGVEPGSIAAINGVEP